MSEKIDRTLKRLAAGTSKASSPTSSSTDGAAPPARPALGDPDCPHCHGLGYLRRELPVEHPEFGRLEICACRQVQVRDHIRQRLRHYSRLDELNGLSFERFDPQGRHNLPPYQRQSLEAAYDASRRFAETLDGWVVLQGGYGCGKTHLAAAIANHAVGLGVPTLFLTVPDLLDSLRYTFQSESGSFEERFEQVRSAPLLVLDDLGTQNATDWAREKLFQILNHRHTNRLPTVLTTNLPLDQIDGRIRSRLLDASQVNLIQILAPDYRLDRDQVGHERLSSLHLHRAQSFANFSTRDNERLSAADLQSLRKAFEAARAFAEDPQGWLVFTGPYGSGKSHLAAAIANHCAGQGIPVMFVLVPDLLDHLRQTFSPHSEVSFDRRFDEVRAVQVLVLDDLGTQATTPWAREKLFQILTHRYHAALPTVITTADDLETIDARLRSRMLDRRLCTVHALTVPSYFVEGIDRSGRPKARRR